MDDTFTIQAYHHLEWIQIYNWTQWKYNMIWKIASGGDILIARGHCQNETEFTTHFVPVVLTNDIPNIKPYDDAIDSRVHLISYIQ